MSECIEEKISIKSIISKQLSLKRQDRQEKDQIQLTIIGEKAVLKKRFLIKHKSPLPKTISYEDRNFNVSEENIFRNYKFNPFENIYRKIAKLKTQYNIFYFSDSKTITPIKLTNTQKINSHTLFVASHATVYKKAIGELIHNVLGDKGKYILYAGIIIIVIVGVYLGYPYLTQHLGNTPIVSPTPTPIIIK